MEAIEDEKMRLKRKGYADKRKELGFKVDQEEIEDPVLDRYAVEDARYQKSLEDQRERPRVKLATDV